MRQGTMVNGELMKFDQIVAAFLDQMKRKAEADCGTELKHVVMGRPVHFIDNDPAADARALADAAAPNSELRFVQAAGHRLRHDPRAVATLLGWLDRQVP